MFFSSTHSNGFPFQSSSSSSSAAVWRYFLSIMLHRCVLINWDLQLLLSLQKRPTDKQPTWRTLFLSGPHSQLINRVWACNYTYLIRAPSAVLGQLAFYWVKVGRSMDVQSPGDMSTVGLCVVASGDWEWFIERLFIMSPWNVELPKRVSPFIEGLEGC